MRHSTRTLRHSSWSLYLVPLALPLVLMCVPGARAPVNGEPGARETQEIMLEEVQAPAPEIPAAQLSNDSSPDAQTLEVSEGRQA